MQLQGMPPAIQGTCVMASEPSPGPSALPKGSEGLSASASLRLWPFRWSLSVMGLHARSRPQPTSQGCPQRLTQPAAPLPAALAPAQPSGACCHTKSAAARHSATDRSSCSASSSFTSPKVRRSGGLCPHGQQAQTLHLVGHQVCHELILQSTLIHP